MFQLLSIGTVNVYKEELTTAFIMSVFIHRIYIDYRAIWFGYIINKFVLALIYLYTWLIIQLNYVFPQKYANGRDAHPVNALSISVKRSKYMHGAG